MHSGILIRGYLAKVAWGKKNNQEPERVKNYNYMRKSFYKVANLLTNFRYDNDRSYYYYTSNMTQQHV